MEQVIPSCLDLFKHHPMQTSIQGYRTVAYKPITAIETYSELKFSIKGSGDRYLDLNDISLNIKLKLVKSGGKPYANGDTEQPGIVNNILHSMFQNCSVTLNGKRVTTSEYYGYRSYLEKLLNYGEDAARTHMICDGWTLDDGTDLDQMKSPNKGFVKRQTWLKNSSLLELEGKLHADALHQGRLLINNVDLEVDLSFAKPDFFLMEKADGSSILKIEEATLYATHYDLDPSILVAHANILSSGIPIAMPYKRVEIKTFTIPANSSMFNNDNLILGKIPNTLIVTMIDSNSFLGKRDKNPFNFHHYSMYSCSVYVDDQVYPCGGYETDFDTSSQKFCTRAYRQLYRALRMHHADGGNQVTKEMFENGYFIMAWNLTRDGSGHENHISSTRTGNLRLQGKFKNSLENAVTVLVYAEYDSEILINNNREVTLL